MAQTVPATVATASPLTLYFDGDNAHEVPARKLGSYSPTTGDRVRVEVRGGGLVPVVQGRVS